MNRQVREIVNDLESMSSRFEGLVGDVDLAFRFHNRMRDLLLALRGELAPKPDVFERIEGIVEDLENVLADLSRVNSRPDAGGVRSVRTAIQTLRAATK